jgi:hypothetical protein
MQWATPIGRGLPTSLTARRVRDGQRAQGWGGFAGSYEGLANADPVDDNGPMMVGILGLDGFSLSEILLLMVVAALLLWKHGGRPPKAS